MVSVQEEECKSKEETRDQRNIPMNMKTYGISQITGKRMINDARAVGYQ